MTHQTMRIVRDTDGHGYTVYDEMEVGGVVHKSEFWIRADRLHLLASAAQAALAEQNSGVMGEAVCKCGITLYPVCDSYVQCPCGCDQCINSACLHDKACHQPQAQRREACQP